MKLKPETQHQITVFDFINTIPVIKNVSFHCPNEGRRGVVAGRILKRMGLRAGAPDIFIAHSKGNYHGLCIELKVGKNKPTEHQINFINQLNKEGYKAEIIYGADAAIQLIKWYLALNKS